MSYPKLKHIECVSTLFSNIKKIEDCEKQEFEKQETDEPPRYYRPLLYYRGQSKDYNNNRDGHKLEPSVMRNENCREYEGAMLRDLITRQPDEFSKFASALDQWVIAQHHGLPTRFLDISANPLVGLFFACNDSKDYSKNGRLYVFATTRDRVKPYDSDSVSIVANFARLRREEQKAILTETERFLDGRDAFVHSSHDYRIMHRSNCRDVTGEVNLYAYRMDYLRREMGRLQTFIRQEKPYFVEGLIDPRDLFRIFIVQPRRLFPRLIAQSGAFLVSAHHKTFDFEPKEHQHGGYRANDNDVPYNYYPLTVEYRKKKCILEELRSLNISEETLFPELEKSAKAVVKDYESRQEGSELKDQLDAIDKIQQAGIDWSVIHTATGIDERTYDTLRRDLANCTRSRPPR